MHRMRSSLLWMLLLSAATAPLYFFKLGYSAPYLSIEEVSQGREAVALATTGRNASGERLPLYFPEDQGRAVRDPLWIYLAAALLQVRPFSEALLRSPSALAGVVNVVLMFFVARELFDRTRPAVVAAVLLAFTPAHFIQSRIATMQIGPVTCTLAWLVFLTRYTKHHRVRDLAAAAVCLGVGMYTYVASFIIMPAYLLLTFFVAWRFPGGTRSTTALSIAAASFGIVVAPIVVWFAVHPAQVVGLTGYYTHGEYNSNLGARGFIGPQAIGHLDAWWDCFSPNKLFFTGDGDVRFSTRQAGHFLMALSVPMLAGLAYAARLLPREQLVILIAGLLLAPLPAAAVSNSEVKRWLTFLPFAIVAATAGVEGMLADRRRMVRASVVVLLIVSAVQARGFFADYFGDYRDRSAVRLGGNLRGAMREVLADSPSADCVLIDAGIDYVGDQWDLYTRAAGRADLAQRVQWMRTDAPPMPPASCEAAAVLARADDRRFAGWQSTSIPEPDGTALFAVYRRERQ